MGTDFVKIDDDVLEIRFHNKEAYLLKRLQLTAASVEEQLRGMRCTGGARAKSRYIEDARLPPFIVSFFEGAFLENRLPTEEEYLARYAAKHIHRNAEGEKVIEWGGKLYGIDAREEALKGRLLRTYPSLVRDLHFYLKCCESPLFSDVRYSMLKDYAEGIDLQLTYAGTDYSLSLYANTLRGRFFKKKKYKRHNYKNVKEIRLGIDLKRESFRVSNFYLYSDDILTRVIKSIEDESTRPPISQA